ncbi:MAG: hypothetical protein R6V62_04455 [Candidatus Fermentibacteraceae bacterium]
MTTRNLQQLPMRTSLMGVVAGAAEYHGYSHSDQFLFGGSGLAFLLNADRGISRQSIHNWPFGGFDGLLVNLGILHEDLGHFGPDITAGERNRLERGIRRLASRGVPCSVKGLEHQLITGFDDHGFLLAAPSVLESETFPDRLDYGTWEQLRGCRSLSFHGFGTTGPVSTEKVVIESLRYFVSSRSNPARYAWYGCVSGPRVYDRWIAALARSEGHIFPGKTLAIVLGECRHMAAGFVRESALLKPCSTEAALELARAFDEVSSGLAGLPSLPTSDAGRALQDLKKREKECLGGVERFLRAFIV